LVTADAESDAAADSGTVADVVTRAGTAVSRNLAGSMLHADSADAVTDAGTDDRTDRVAERFTECARFSNAVTNGIAYTDAAPVRSRVTVSVTIPASDPDTARR
jgi:hypothetical protein